MKGEELLRKLASAWMLLGMATTIACGIGVAPSLAVDRPNVLLLVVDDLRPELGCYGASHMHTPHIDRLAAEGILFERAYCQMALCNPSRASFLTGLRPDTTRILGNDGHVRDARSEVATLPQSFKVQGYHVQGLGKIFHPGLDDAESWSVPHWDPLHANIHHRGAMLVEEMKGYYGPEGQKAVEARLEDFRRSGKAIDLIRRKDLLGPPWEMADVPDEELADGKIAIRAMEVLREVKGRPFFLAVGFLKPHLPFSVPKPYWELYPSLKEEEAPRARPKGVLPAAFHESNELRGFDGMPAKGPISSTDTQQLVRGYRAAVSYVDRQIGLVLEELERLDLRDRTIVMLVGDHGFHLGEQGMWGKHTHFEVAARVPLIIRLPDRHRAGSRATGLVELVDCSATLMELAQVRIPERLEGMSFVPLIESPNRSWKSGVFTQCHPPGKDGMVGRSLRTERWRYTEWRDTDQKVVGVELYDHHLDPREATNLAIDSRYRATCEHLAGILEKGWKASLPPELPR